MTNAHRLGLALMVLLGASAATTAAPGTGIRHVAEGESLAGRLLVAAPSMPDPRFHHAVVYVCEHDASGTLGLIVNRRTGAVPAARIAEQFGLGEAVRPADVSLPLLWGGPVDPGRGFVLHTDDYASDSTRSVGGGVAYSVDEKALTDLVEGHGGRQGLLVLGYTGWAPGQLEAEMAHDDWVVVPADPAFLFDEDADAMWQAAMDRLGIDL